MEPQPGARTAAGDRCLLLALAVRRSGRFVTFDRSVALSAVPGATAENLTVL
ncbi:MAG: hypothetical protein ACRDSE_02430 [Pseudonocardiaceae bacterium]